MNRIKTLTTILLSASIFLAASLAQGTIVALYQDSGDLAANFTATTGTGTSVTEVSSTVLDGSAISMVDAGSGKSTLRYLPSATFLDPIQITYDVADFSTDSYNVFAIGANGANLSRGVERSVAFRIESGGSVRAEIPGATIQFTGAFTPGSAFNVSLIYNPSSSLGSLDLSGSGGPVLASGEWAFYIDGALLDNGAETSVNLSELAPTENTIGTTDFWFLTSNPSSATGLDIELDNIVLATGADIAVPVPEPSAFALFAGMVALGYIGYRRRRA